MAPPTDTVVLFPVNVLSDTVNEERKPGWAIAPPRAAELFVNTESFTVSVPPGKYTAPPASNPETMPFCIVRSLRTTVDPKAI